MKIELDRNERDLLLAFVRQYKEKGRRAPEDYPQWLLCLDIERKLTEEGSWQSNDATAS